VAALLVALALLAGWMVAERRAAVSCRPFASPGTEVWLVLGQSNAANFAEVRHRAGAAVGAFNGSGCVEAADPLPGADGTAGTLWVPLAQAWVEEKRASRVLIAATAQSATSVEQWTPGARLHRRALNRIVALERRGLQVTRILWIQGEADAILNTPVGAYSEALKATLEPLYQRTGAPVFIALASRCGDARSPAVRFAQERVIADERWALPGPDLDTIRDTQRFERCHFAREGQAQAVALWLRALRGTGI
jgi:hypothetical protein